MPIQETKRQIIWAVDPFAKDIVLQESTARAIQALIKGTSTEVEPVFLAEFYPFEFANTGGALIGLPPDRVGEATRSMQAAGQKKLDKILKRTKIPGIKPLKLLSEPYHSLGLTAETLVTYAKQSGADLIALSTRARKGPVRWVMGSFAETLTLNSDIPLFVVNPLWKSSATFKHILFPTDFSVESKKAFGKVLAMAKMLGSKISIFHKVAYTVGPTFDSAFMPQALYKRILREEVQARQAEGQKWIVLANTMGVKASFTIDTQKGTTTEEAILAKAKAKPGITAMAARSGQISSAVLGSVARKMLRSSPQPVWVFHSERKKQQEAIFSVTEFDVIADLHVPELRKGA